MILEARKLMFGICILLSDLFLKPSACICKIYISVFLKERPSERVPWDKNTESEDNGKDRQTRKTCERLDKDQ